jgi:rhodanese-related sulfurtransferase
VPVAVPEISVAELAERLDDAVLIDVRQPDEYVAGHVRSARLIPLHTLPDHLGDLPVDAEVLVICHTGSRSYWASEYLIENGLRAVNVAGGTSAWIDNGGAVVAGDQPA